jgi:hypothetical protein
MTTPSTPTHHSHPSTPPIFPNINLEPYPRLLEQMRVPDNKEKCNRNLALDSKNWKEILNFVIENSRGNHIIYIYIKNKKKYIYLFLLLFIFFYFIFILNIFFIIYFILFK